MRLSSAKRRLPSPSRRRGHERVHEEDQGVVHELVEAAKGGDRLAFAALFDRFHPVVYRMLRSRVGVREDAEDLVAECFLDAWKSLGRHEWVGAPFAAWLLMIANSRAIDHHRRAASRPVTNEHAEQLDRVLDGGDDHGQTEERIEALRLLATLPEEQRTVLALRFYGGMSAEEIGAMLGKRPGAVRQMQMVALERLGRRYRQEQAA